MLSTQQVRTLATLPGSDHTLFDVEAHSWVKIEQGDDPFRDIRQRFRDNDEVLMVDNQYQEVWDPEYIPFRDYDLYLVHNTVNYVSKNQYGTDKYSLVSLYVVNNDIKTKLWLNRATQLFADSDISDQHPFVVYDRWNNLGQSSGHGMSKNPRLDVGPFYGGIWAPKPHPGLRRTAGSQLVNYYPWCLEDFINQRWPDEVTPEMLIGTYTAIKTNVIKH